MLYKNLFKNIDVLNTKGKLEEGLNIKNIAYHTDNVVPGTLFVAVKGYVTDGHNYVDVASKRGASIAVVEEFLDINIPQIKVLNSRIALADLAANFYMNSSRNMVTIGITATNGKTTTTYMIDKILNYANFNTGVIGSVEIKYADISIPSQLTTPESLDLQSYISEMKKSGVEVLTMEVSSSAQELYRNKNIDFNIVAFNNISREHIDQHGNFENYYKVKSKLVKDASSNTIAILNRDYDLINKLSEDSDAYILKYSLEREDSDFYISDLDLSTGKGVYVFHIPRDISINGVNINRGEFTVELSVAGYSSVMNSVVAIIVALLNNISQDTIKKALLDFSGVERRFEMIYDEKYKIIDDHFANTKNIEVTFKTLEKMKYNDFHFLYAIRGNRGVNLNRENADEIVKWVKKLNPKYFIATISTDTVGAKDKVLKEELEVFMETMNRNGIEVKLIDKVEDAVNNIMENIKSEDILLLAGCQGMDKGAHFALNNIIDHNLTSDAQKLQDLLNNRTC